MITIITSSTNISEHQGIPGSHLFSTICYDWHKNNSSKISLSDTINYFHTNNHHQYCKVSIPKCHKISQQRRSIYNSTIQIFYILSMFFVATSQNELGRRTVWRLGISINDGISHSSYFLIWLEPIYKSCNNSIEVTQVLEDLWVRLNRCAHFASLICSLHHSIPKVHIRRVLSIAMKEDLLSYSIIHSPYSRFASRENSKTTLLQVKLI